MRIILKAVLLSFVAILSGCASPAQYGRSISYEEASAFEKSLQVGETQLPQRTEELYTQPLNKDVPCKLPTTQEQLVRNNFRAYWDGQCKNGYAYGLGRDIAVSDTHHLEEITIYDGTGKWSKRPSAGYDFVNNIVAYRMLGEKEPTMSGSYEYMQNSLNGFNIMYKIGVTDESGRSLITQAGPFSPTRVFLYVGESVVYRFTDNTSMPMINDSAIKFSVEILDKKTKKVGGAAIAFYGNGQVRHFLMKGTQPEMVTLPTEYVSELNEKYRAVVNAQKIANVSVERARQIEREYLYMACNGKHVIRGLDEETSTKICNWREQFKVPYENALAKYKQDLEQMKQKAETVEQQRQIQQQIALQQQRLEQQQSQLALQKSLNELEQTGRQLQNTSQQMMHSIMSQPAPQVVPWGQSGSNQVNCVTVGSVTNCQ